jgi:hypothetical protein
MAISVVGVDLSKSVFQLSVADAKHHVSAAGSGMKLEFAMVRVSDSSLPTPLSAIYSILEGTWSRRSIIGI